MSPSWEVIPSFWTKMAVLTPCFHAPHVPWGTRSGSGFDFSPQAPNPSGTATPRGAGGRGQLAVWIWGVAPLRRLGLALNFTTGPADPL